MDLSKKIILCDTSYIIFYRYYAVINWYKKHTEISTISQNDIENILSNDVFIEKYNSTFEKFITELSKKNKIPYNNIVFAKDCPRERIWRTELLPSYKGTREDKLGSFNGDIFRHTYNTLFPILKNKYNFQEIFHNRLEADDLIALMTFKLKSLIPNVDIMIITNDNDFVQLEKYNVDIKNLQGKSLVDRVNKVLNGLDISKYLQYKIIIGDISDNITSIAKKIGPKTASKLIEDPNSLNKLLKNDDVKSKYELNTKLIDFTKIPEEYISEFDEYIRDFI